uniref:GMC_oxred_C domain-containing protein n=2 Tax=Mesocestoides corti TaxID=53468 RepID=A0A5K3G1B3_MESCO
MFSRSVPPHNSSLHVLSDVRDQFEARCIQAPDRDGNADGGQIPPTSIELSHKQDWQDLAVLTAEMIAVNVGRQNFGEDVVLIIGDTNVTIRSGVLIMSTEFLLHMMFRHNDAFSDLCVVIMDK